MKHKTNLACTLLFTAILSNSIATGRADNVPQQTASTANVPPATQLGAGLIDDSDPGWIWSGMVEYDDPSLQGGTGHAGGPGSYGAYTFHGTGVQIFGYAAPSLTVDGRVHKVGRAQISIDGKPVATVSMAHAEDQFGFSIADLSNLSNSNHVLQIEPTGGWIVIDYINVIDVTRPQVDDAHSSDVHTSSIDGDSKSKGKPATGTDEHGATLPDGRYLLALRADRQKFLSIHDVTPVDGSLSEIDGPARDKMQIWQLTSVGPGVYRLSPADAPGEALTVLPIFKSVGYAIGTVSYSESNKYAQWNIVPTDSGYYRIVSAVEPDDVVDLLFANDHDGSSLVLYSWHQADTQQYSFQRTNG